MIWIVLLIGLFVVYSSSRSRVRGETPTSSNVTNPTVYKIAESRNVGTKPKSTVITRTPPPGYQGPVNGPFTWAGVGNPPNGVYVTEGNIVY